jgi:hypothetical protein
MRRFGYALHNVKALHDAGVTIALGTDAGMPGTPHGSSTLHEMELLVKAGLTPTQALMAGTGGATLLWKTASWIPWICQPCSARKRVRTSSALTRRGVFGMSNSIAKARR